MKILPKKKKDADKEDRVGLDSKQKKKRKSLGRRM